MLRVEYTVVHVSLDITSLFDMVIILSFNAVPD